MRLAALLGARIFRAPRGASRAGEPKLIRIVHPDGLPTPLRYWSMLAIAIGIAMSVLDGAVANIALPAIAAEFHASPAESIWVVNAYQLAVVMGLLPLASLGERIGYRRVYLWGLAIFTLGSVACALSQNMPELIVARVGQGFGAAGVFAVNGALVRFTYPGALLGRGVGLNAFVVSVSAAVGPTVAAAILAVGPWQWLFAINAPFGIVNLVVAYRALPHSDRGGRPFDVVSATLNALAFGLFFVGADAVTHGEGTMALALAEVVAAFVALAALVRRESKVEAPLIPVDLMRIPIFALSVATSICSFTAQSLALVAMPFYFELALGRSQVETGLLMTPWPMAVGVAAPIAGRLSDRVPAAILGFVGLAGLAIGMVAAGASAARRRVSSTSPGRWLCAARASASSRRPTTARCSLRRRAGAPGRRAACWRPRG